MRKKRKDYREKQDKVTAKLNRLHVADEEYYLAVESFLNLASRAREVFLSSEMDELLSTSGKTF